MRVAVLVVGILLTLWTFVDLVRSMLIPHSKPGFIPAAVTGSVWRLARAWLPAKRSYAAQNRWLSGVGPFSLIILLIVYTVILILTLGMIFFGLSDLSYGDSLYQSGSTVTTLGIVEAVTPASTAVTFVAAFLGLIVISIFIGYLMSTYTAYVARESQMARLDMLAGEPAWGVQILVRGHLLGMPHASLPDGETWVDWMTSVRLNHEVNATLATFRSTSSLRHWSITMLAVMDAAALRLALEPDSARPVLLELLTQGAETMHVLHRSAKAHDKKLSNWQLEAAVLAAVNGRSTSVLGESHVTRADFEDALHELESVGYPLPSDRDAAWVRFEAYRRIYATDAVTLANEYHAVPAPWSGSRTPGMAVQWPARAGLVKDI